MEIYSAQVHKKILFYVEFLAILIPFEEQVSGARKQHSGDNIKFTFKAYDSIFDNDDENPWDSIPAFLALHGTISFWTRFNFEQMV